MPIKEEQTPNLIVLLLDCHVGLVIEFGSCVQATDVEISHSKVGIVVKNRTGDNIKLERVNSRCDRVRDIFWTL